MIDYLEDQNYEFKGLWEGGLLYKKRYKKKVLTVLVHPSYQTYTINKWEYKNLTYSSTHLYKNKPKFIKDVTHAEDNDTIGS